jgi:hypothetical protein
MKMAGLDSAEVTRSHRTMNIIGRTTIESAARDVEEAWQATI